ncbi:uncharacterized protein LOC142629051 [Castanea sativa]|uniref:uncharacterized protein LOC142629051 n=1 Tax=Castanea sativa TaxID=21020 RepID=UPI003F64B897
MASYHLDGEALIWFQEAEQARGFACWEMFVQALQTRFGTTAYADPMEALTRLKQDEIRLPIRMSVPKTLNEAFGVKPRTKVPLQRLTGAQMEERRKRGLCYNCDDKWQMGHKCKGAKLFLLEEISMEVEPRASGVQLVEITDDEVFVVPTGLPPVRGHEHVLPSRKAPNLFMKDLIGYYRKFIKGYGSIAQPLIDLLRKDAFYCNDKTLAAFTNLKEAVTQPSVLALLDFFRPFVVECDASSCGLGAVLMQDQRPVAFHSHALKGKNLHLSTYETELLALATAVKKWRSYLLGRPFVVRTNHQSLKFLLEQRIATPPQQKWLAKLLDMPLWWNIKGVVTIEWLMLYQGILISILSVPNPTWLSLLRDSYSQDAPIQNIIASIQAGNPPKGFDFQNGLLFYKVSDKDATFTSLLWYELFRLQGTDFSMSSAYHPQLDRQSKIANKSLEQYLRAFTSDRPYQWATWLPLAEFWFNNSFHTCLKLSPFEALYGFSAPKLQAYIPGTTRVDALDSLLCQRQAILDILEVHLVVAQARMKFQADKHRQDRSFEVGDWMKLGQHVTPIPTLPPVDESGQVLSEPIFVLKTRKKSLRSQVITEVLVQWLGSSLADATWETLHQLQLAFPHLVGKVL